MRKEKVIPTCSRLAGVLLLLAVIPHVTLGYAEILQGIKFGDIRSPMVATVRNIWLFSAIMLFLSGIWILFLVKDLKNFRRKAWWQALLIGLGYAAGGIAAMMWNGIQIHLLLFVLIGLLLIIPMLIWVGSFSSRNIKNH